MHKSIKEMADLTGVTVRTLHYYDEIGLLVPSEVVYETGYRYYDENSLEQLQQILFYRELDFPLKEIVQIMNTSSYNKQEALQKQRTLLTMKKERLERLITLLDASLKGEKTMSFQEFDNSKYEETRKAYAAEAKERWGKTDAYQQSQEKTKGYQKEDWKQMNAGMDRLIQQFAAQRGKAPESADVQQLVREWQQYITEHFYECTNEILAGLGQMYIADERFLQNMDRFGEGTTKLMSEAIRVYVANGTEKE